MPIDNYPQVKGFIISYVRDLKDAYQPEFNRYCHLISNCKIEFNQTNNFTHYKYPNGDSKFEFDAIFDQWDGNDVSDGKNGFECKNFEVVLHNRCRNCPNNPIQFLNKNKIDCDTSARIKPWQHGR